MLTAESLYSKPMVTIHQLEEPVRLINVVRDDLLVGGTKEAALVSVLMHLDGEEFVYAGPRYGYAQIALAVACRRINRRATLFMADSKELHPRSIIAAQHGAKIVRVPNGYLTTVQCRAREYCRKTGATMLPFGLDCEAMKIAISERALSLNMNPAQVWSVAGSGLLQRGLQMAWPHAQFYAVRIGKETRAGRATVMTAPEKYEQPAKELPPFPSCDNYDAKAWQFIVRHAGNMSLFWNVGG